MDKKAKEVARRKKLASKQKWAAENRAKPGTPSFVPTPAAAPLEAAELSHRRQQAREKATAERERRLYPDFVFVQNDAPSEFVALVQKACAAVDFRDRSMFHEWEAAAYRAIRQGQPAPVFLEPTGTGEMGQATLANVHFATNLGEQVFRHIPPADLSRHIPQNDVLFLPHDRVVYVYFNSLCRARGAGGTTYYSRHRPMVEVDGRQLVVGFSTHAIERACERMLARPLCYTNLSDVFAVFEQCLEYEVVRLPRGDIGFTFWEHCPEGFWMRSTAKHVLGDQFDTSAPYSYRVGYCPAVVEGEFLKAKTLLYPGWSGTPEYSLLRGAVTSPAQKSEWLSLLDGMDGMRFRFEAPPLLKWFHEQGVLQIRRGEPRHAPPYDYNRLVRPR